MSDSKKQKRKGKYPWSYLLIEVIKKGLLINRKKNKADLVRETVNNILHSGNSITKEKSLEVIRNTFEIIEKLYGNDSVKRPELQKRLR